jgi:hypothetical protein
MARYALVDQANVVQNVVLWDGTTGWTTPSGYTAVLIPANTACAPGYTYNGSTFLFGQLPAQVNAQNEATIRQNITDALARLRQIKTQADALQNVANYATANVTNLNDLLAKVKQVGAAVGDLATDVLYVARVLSDQFDGTT